jgi:ubiquinone/menaquinone biosynthesis C-methylase UbiE
MVQGTRRYDRLADQYSQYRPRYPEQLISHLADIIAKAPASNLDVDVGSDTGIFTRQLRAALPDAMRIVGIEPSPSMRTQAVTETADHTGLAFGDGVAEHLPFVGDAARAVVAATCACPRAFASIGKVAYRSRGGKATNAGVDSTLRQGVSSAKPA